MKTVACALLFLALTSCKPSEESELKAIVGAILMDGTGGPPMSDSVVLIAGARIRAVGRRSEVPIPPGTQVFDGSGKFLVPGLIDVHVHLGTRAGPHFSASEYTREQIERNLNTYLYFGVTSVRSIGTERDAGFAVRSAEQQGSFASARLFTAGRGFTAPGGHPSQEIGSIARQTDDPADARRQVDELAGQHVDAIKIWVDDVHGRQPKVKPAVIEAILDQARKYRIPVTAHIYSLADTRFLVRNGAAGFLHMVQDTEEIDPAFLAELRNLQLVFDPTLVRQELAWLYARHPERLDDPDVKRAIDPDVIAAVRSQPASPASRDYEIACRNTRTLAAAGVPIAVGSDGGSASDFPGAMTHREMELLVECGLSPSEVITAATRNGALALRKLDDLGTLERGKLADMLLVSANPTVDVRNLRRIDRIMLNGRWVDRDGLKLR